VDKEKPLTSTNPHHYTATFGLHVFFVVRSTLLRPHFCCTLCTLKLHYAVWLLLQNRLSRARRMPAFSFGIRHSQYCCPAPDLNTDPTAAFILGSDVW